MMMVPGPGQVTFALVSCVVSGASGMFLTNSNFLYQVREIFYWGAIFQYEKKIYYKNFFGQCKSNKVNESQMNTNIESNRRIVINLGQQESNIYFPAKK